MTKEKPIRANNALDILKEIYSSLQDIYNNKDLFDENQKLSQENIEKFSLQFDLQIEKFYCDNVDILLESIKKNKWIFSQIFARFIEIKLTSADNMINLLSLSKEANQNLRQKQIEAENIRQIIECKFRGIPYLGLAISSGQLKMVVKLTELGANIKFITEEESYTYLHLLLKKFIEIEPSLNEKNRNLAVEAVTSLAQNLIGAGVDANSQDIHGNTAFHYAALIDEPLVTICLITANAKANIKNREGNTPLHIALIVENLQVAKLLAASNCSIFENNKGKFPIDIARKKSYTEIIKIIEAQSPYFELKLQDVEVMPAKADTVPAKEKPTSLGQKLWQFFRRL